jgi:DNA-binding response OmpR family regulator
LILDEDAAASSFLGMVLRREQFLPILADIQEAALQSLCTLRPDLLIISAPLAGTGNGFSRGIARNRSLS